MLRARSVDQLRSPRSKLLGRWWLVMSRHSARALEFPFLGCEVRIGFKRKRVTALLAATRGVNSDPSDETVTCLVGAGLQVLSALYHCTRWGLFRGWLVRSETTSQCRVEVGGAGISLQSLNLHVPVPPGKRLPRPSAASRRAVKRML